MNTSFDHLSDQELGDASGRRVRTPSSSRPKPPTRWTSRERRSFPSNRDKGVHALRRFASSPGFILSLNALLREEAVHVDLAPKFRKHFGKEDKAVEDAARLLADLAQAEVELENLLGVKRVRNYPPERVIVPGDVRTQAEQDATELRQWLGSASRP